MLPLGAGGFEARAGALFAGFPDRERGGAAPGARWALAPPPPPAGAAGASQGGGSASGGEPREGPMVIPHAALALEGFGAVGAQQGPGAAPAPFEPSDAFCTALDREPEESPEDRVALGLEPLHLPGHLAGTRAGGAPPPPPPPVGARTAQGSPQGPPRASAPSLDPGQPPRKRVRFAPQSLMSPKALVGGGRRAGGEAVVGGGRRRVRGGVPDHVQNPGNYTCYSLEEPLYVGRAASDRVSNGPRDTPAEGTAAGDWGRDYLSEEEAGTAEARRPRALGHVFRSRSVQGAAPRAGGGGGSGSGSDGCGSGGKRSTSQGLLSFATTTEGG